MKENFEITPQIKTRSRRWFITRAGVGVAEVALGVTDPTNNPIASGTARVAGIVTLLDLFVLHNPGDIDPITTGLVAGTVSNLIDRFSL